MESTKWGERLEVILRNGSHYYKFIIGYSKKATTITNLWKKDFKWIYFNRCCLILIKSMTSDPILKLPNFGFPFEVHTDTSNEVFRGVLVQEGHQWPLKVKY